MRIPSNKALSTFIFAIWQTSDKMYEYLWGLNTNMSSCKTLRFALGKHRPSVKLRKYSWWRLSRN